MTPDMLPPTIAARVRVDGNGCWRWTARLTWRKYAIVTFQGKSEGVHRLAYRTLVGEIPAGYEIDHLCRVADCCNPSHLEAVTPQENMRRAWEYRRRWADEGKVPYVRTPGGERRFSEDDISAVMVVEESA